MQSPECKNISTNPLLKNEPDHAIYQVYLDSKKRWRYALSTLTDEEVIKKIVEKHQRDPHKTRSGNYALNRLTIVKITKDDAIKIYTEAMERQRSVANKYKVQLQNKNT